MTLDGRVRRMTGMDATADRDSEVARDPELERHMAVFRRGAVDLIEEREIAERLAAGRPLRIKFGMDPSSPDLHVGHAIPLLALRRMQDLGHQVVLIVGDATAMVGDPSGRNELRPVLSREEVERNLTTYTEQAARILDMERTEVRRNSEWFDALGFEGLLNLTTRMTVSQMIERDTFKRRIARNEPIGINEFLYPLMQGWDSVQVRADVELGGSDQLFNLHVGRRLQEQEGQRGQSIRTHPLILGVDGRKMSKSLGNAIGIVDSARDMTFAVMRLDDDAMETWFVQLTDLPAEEIAGLLAGHPRQAKARLAWEIAAFFHGTGDADRARAAFDSEVRDKELPAEVAEHAWDDAWGESLAVPNLLKAIGMVASTSEARRAIEQGGLRLDGEVFSDPKGALSRDRAPVLVQLGKKRVARVVP